MASLPLIPPPNPGDVVRVYLGRTFNQCFYLTAPATRTDHLPSGVGRDRDVFIVLARLLNNSPRNHWLYLLGRDGMGWHLYSESDACVRSIQHPLGP